MNDAQRVKVGAIEVAYDTFGEAADPPVVLVMGLGAQMHYWHEELCAAIAARGLYVIRFDNRDVGHSTHFSDAGAMDLTSPKLAASTPYALADLAADVAGLIAALGLGSAHLLGVSMGGMIVQLVAIEYPERVRSLTSISSTTGDPAVGASRPEALSALFTPPPSATREAICDRALSLSRVIGSPGFELDEPWLRERAGRAFDRSYDPDGVTRQAAAIVTSADRTPRLRDLRVPTLVIHGSDDQLVDVSGGRATAEAIPDAELLVIDGMGHDLPRAVWDEVGDAIRRTVARAE